MKRENYFNRDNHLNDQGIAYCVDTIRAGNTESIEPIIVNHIEDCFSCKQKIMSAIDLLNEIDNIL